MGNISVEPVSVSIYDARVLPAVIMADLLRITNKRNHFQVKVKVVHRILSGYLARIGIPHSLIEVKNVKISKSLNCKAICLGGSAVITSYSIHYTKLYDCVNFSFIEPKKNSLFDDVN